MKLFSQYGTPLTAEREARMRWVMEHRQNDLTVILENVNDPHNIAAVMRTCDAVGMLEMFVVNTTPNTFRNFDERISSSANKWMIVHQFTDLETCFREVRKKYTGIFSTSLATDAIELYKLDLTLTVALVFGNERRGISEECQALCNGNFMVPQAGMIPSLNISVACAVSLYEAYRQKSDKGHYAQPKLSGSDCEQILNQWNISDKPYK